MKFYPKFIFRSPLNPTQKIFDDVFFPEALYLATPVLYDEYQKNLIKSIDDLKDLKKLNISIYKYEARARARCTPFGLFAGLSIGEWCEQSNIKIDSNQSNALKRKTRLDMNVLYALSQKVASKNFIRPYIKFYPNSSIYLINNSYRYVEYYYKNNRRFHKINRVDFSPYLEKILTVSENGLTHKELVKLLTNSEISTNEASDFIDEVIDSQLLCDQLEPTVTGTDYFESLIITLDNIYTTNPVNDLRLLLKILKDVSVLIEEIDFNISNSSTIYRNIYHQLKRILPDLKETNLFQTDLYKEAIDSTLDIKIQQQLIEAVTFLNKISPKNSLQNMEAFKERFYEYYGDNEIPLLIALDTETGVGYPGKDNNGVNNLIDDIYSYNPRVEMNLKWTLLEAHLLKLIDKSIKSNKKSISISERDFENIDFSDGSLPYSYSIMFKVLNSETNKIDITNIGGTSGINLLARFAGGNKELENIVRNIAQFEQDQEPNKIIAEIVHLPESRTGNILARPSFRPYEIPYLAKSSVEKEYQIQTKDLVLKIKDNTIILYDTRLEKEIIPRLGNAHNFANNSLPVYHFLCDLQSQYFSKSNIGFNWGYLSGQFDFLPRVEYKNIVLSPARWQLKKGDLEPFKNKKNSETERRSLFWELKSRVDLPEIFLIIDGDNELLINCDDDIAIDVFIDEVKAKNEIILKEYLFEKEALINDTQGRPYTNECIALILNESKIIKEFNQFGSLKNSSRQNFSVGSEWLYYKIYCGVKTIDYILTEKIKIVTKTLLDENAIDKWFFIRYADPDVHVRLRLHVCDFKRYGDILQLINTELEPLIDRNIVLKIQTDTYKRELERYGDNSIEFAEQLFCNDSLFVTDMLCFLDADEGEVIRWKIAIRSVDAFLNDFKFTLEQKYALINELSIAFFGEHGAKKELKLLLDNKFRSLRAEIHAVLDIEKDNEKEYYPILQLINDRSILNKLPIDNILFLNSTGKLKITINSLLSSLMHMNLDRLFMGRNRTNEFVVYDLLSRHYKSAIARLKPSVERKIVNS